MRDRIAVVFFLCGAPQLCCARSNNTNEFVFASMYVFACDVCVCVCVCLCVCVFVSASLIDRCGRINCAGSHGTINKACQVDL